MGVWRGRTSDRWWVFGANGRELGVEIHSLSESHLQVAEGSGDLGVSSLNGGTPKNTPK